VEASSLSGRSTNVPFKLSLIVRACCGDPWGGFVVLWYGRGDGVSGLGKLESAVSWRPLGTQTQCRMLGVLRCGDDCNSVWKLAVSVLAQTRRTYENSGKAVA